MATFQDITVAPGEAPVVDKCHAADASTTYSVAFETAGLVVIVSPGELQELVARAMVAMADAPTVDLS